METQNFFSSRFGKKGIKDNKLEKVYFQRKINTQNYPLLQKNLKTFFEDYSKYFETSYDNNQIIVGKKYKKNDRNKHRISMSEKGNQKSKSKRIMRRPTIKRQLLMKSDSINRSKYTYDSKKKSFEENNLKPGQRIIDDKEIDKLFNIFRKLRRKNKNRGNNFENVEELKEFKEFKNESNFIIKSTESLFKMNSISNLDKKSSNLINSEDKKRRNSTRNYNIDSNNESEYNRTISTNMGNTIQDEGTKNNYLKSIETDKEEKQRFLYNTDIIKKRKKLIEKQNQYLYPKVQLSLKNQFAEYLALQENVFLLKNKNNKFQNTFKNYLHNHIKRRKNLRLLIEDNSHLKNQEIKKKINFFQNKLNPDRIYNWYSDLHSSKNSLPLLESNIETIRNPKNMKGFSDEVIKTFEKDDYLKNNITSKYYKNLEKELNNANHNFEGLIVQGKNLLELENNMAKKLKGRKILNDFERLLSPSKLKNENIYSNIFGKSYK